MAPVESKGALPNLIIIGAMKCGTSSLHRYLDLHPEISMSALKEPNYFIDPAGGAPSTLDRGIDWYRSLFDPAAPIRGEASVNYTSLPATGGTAAQIAAALGEPKLIYMVREPVSRTISHYMHAKAAGREPRGIDEALADPHSRYVRRSLYATQLEPFIEAFGREALLIETQGALMSDRRATLQRAFEFLAVDPDFDSPEFDRLWEVSSGKSRRFTFAYKLSRRIGGGEWVTRLPPRVRWAGERLFLGGGKKQAVERPAISAATEASLRQAFAPELDRLEEISGLDLSAWQA